MARSPDKRIEQAKELFLKGMKLVKIANQLNLSEGTVRSWKSRYKWDCNVANGKRNVAKRKRGGQPGNKNAVGGPPGNKHAEKYGFFSKYLPEETISIIQEMPTDPLDVLWDQIQIAYAAIIRAQQIMYVKDRTDKTIEKIEEKDGNVIGERWDVQQAWDKQSGFLQAQARAQKTLEGMINRYVELLHKRWDLATEEQKARIEQMRANAERIRKDSSVVEDDGVEIINDTAEEAASANLGNHSSEIPADIQ